MTYHIDPPPPSSSRTGGDEEPLGDIVTRLIESGRTYANAEIDRQKLRAAILASGLKGVVILATVALILLFGALVTLMIGLVFALAPFLTPLGATAAVCGVALLAVAILAYIVSKRVGRLFDWNEP